VSRSYNYRQHQRYVHGRRRIKEDRAQHGSDHACPCFAEEAERGQGRVFAQFADNPKLCSGPCCGNPRRHFDDQTIQELRFIGGKKKSHYWMGAR
jgi:hypothetical protein